MSGKLGMAGRGASSDRLGVAIGCRNIVLPVVIRYCGPAAKFVSCAAETPARTGSSKVRNAIRIRSSCKEDAKIQREDAEILQPSSNMTELRHGPIWRFTGAQ